MASLLVVLTSGAQAQPAQPQRDDLIVEMHSAFSANNRARLSQLLPAARGHTLEPWAAYWEIRARLDTATSQEIQDFFSRYAGTYQEDRLRNDWLLLLGQRRQWDEFSAEWPRFRMRDDREVQCYALLVQHLRDGANFAPANQEQVRSLWLAQRDAADACPLAASRLIASGVGSKLTQADAWRKARLAIEANRPRAAIQAVEIIAPEALPQVSELHADPARFLASRAVAASRVRREMVGLALIRLATTNFDAAVRAFDEKWSSQLPMEERDWISGLLGRISAQRLQPQALEYYARVARPAHLSEDMLVWNARAALRAGSTPNWPVLLQAINAMPPEARQESTWIYWRARALLAGRPTDANRTEAQRLLESIAGVRGFYEQLALEDLGGKIAVPVKPAPPTEAEKEVARTDPGLARALYAIGLGLRTEGVREWNYTTNLHKPSGMSDRELLAAAQLACERQVWDRCINTSERSKGEFDADQRFPMPFRESVVRRAGEIGLDPAYVYGLIRQESRFIMDARSHVGASGLMQVMPATARWTARRLGMTGFTDSQITDRETNIAIGTGYLKLVLDDFGGSMPMAAAAYNAGPGRPRAWRNGPTMEAAAWAENVPFHETRDYVKKVLANTTMYAAIITGQPQSLKARLGAVGPREGSSQPENRDLP